MATTLPFTLSPIPPISPAPMPRAMQRIGHRTGHRQQPERLRHRHHHVRATPLPRNTRSPLARTAFRRCRTLPGTRSSSPARSARLQRFPEHALLHLLRWWISVAQPGQRRWAAALPWTLPELFSQHVHHRRDQHAGRNRAPSGERSAFPLFNAQQSCLNEAGNHGTCSSNTPTTTPDAFVAKINPNLPRLQSDLLHLYRRQR